MHLRLRSHHTFGVLALLFGTLACVTSLKSRDVEPQGWWAERGPVIPHEDFPTDCSLCHTGDNWYTIRADFEFDHELETGVPLLGAHASAECLRCHNDRGPVQLFDGRGCAGCHEDVHRGQLGSDCALCHDEKSWRPIERLSFHDRTRFPLFGAHAAVECWACHPGAEVGEFTRADPTCESCHEAVAALSSSPDHTVLGWTTNCERCHVPTRWEAGAYRHPLFELGGAHLVTSCDSCHTSAVYEGTANLCIDCHGDDYSHAPEHLAEGFSTTCEECHGDAVWDDVPAFTHAGVQAGCSTCHFEDDFLSTTDPDHVAEAFPMTCEDCHNFLTWEPGQFDHAGIVKNCDECHQKDADDAVEPDHTDFPPLCEECHNTTQWYFLFFNHEEITTGCAECHIADYNTTTDPDHAATGMSMACEECHEYPEWLPVDPLSGRQPGLPGFEHRDVRGGCARCHLTDYRKTTNPNHRTARFALACEDCHGTRSWSGASFAHRFPIRTGAHSGLSCADCHPGSRGFRGASCTACHEHGAKRMGKEHARVKRYVWQSRACVQCHPDGRR